MGVLSNGPKACKVIREKKERRTISYKNKLVYIPRRGIRGT